MKTYLKFTGIILAGFVLMKCNYRSKEMGDEKSEVQKENINLLEPDHAFAEALKLFAKADYTKSSEEIENGISVMKSIAKNASEEQKKRIDDSIAELKDLASDVENDHVEGINELNYFFAKAGRALAGNKLFVSKNEFPTLTPQQAGDTLLKAIEQVVSTLHYNGREMNGKEQEMINKARSVASRLKNGEKIKHVEIEMTYDQLQNQLDNWSIEFSNKQYARK